MPDKPIINARRELDWRRRLFSDLATGVLWMGWVYLWIPVIAKFHEIIVHHINLETAAMEVLDTVAPISITRSVILLLGTSALLMLWALLPKRKVPHAHRTVTLEDYARVSGLDPQTLEAGRASRICTVTHDEDGRFVRIEPTV